MAKKPTNDEAPWESTPVEFPAPGPSDPIEAVADAPKGPIPGEVYVLNLTKEDWDITLTDGTNLALGPMTRDGKWNKSRIIAKKLLPPHVRKAAALSPPRLRIVDAVE